MILPLLLAVAAQAVTKPAAAGPIAPDDARSQHCLELAANDPPSGAKEADRWSIAGGGFLAKQCLGMAYASGDRMASAAQSFEDAAHAAELAHDARGATYWAEAGNAWLAAGEASKARAALDAALAADTLTGVQRGEALIDRARAQVAQGQLVAARADLDKALGDAAADPMAWLLSATLARRMEDVPRAKTDIAEALRLAPDDASVQLEAGNIAATGHDEAGAEAAWTRAAQLAPDSDPGRAAKQALRQFDTPAAPAAAPTP
jgi:tetratricopeptide (TPR) repeat protein